MGGVLGALLGLALIPLFALVFRAVRARYWRRGPLGSRAPRSQATTTTALGGGWEQNSSGQQVNISLENNTAQRARDSIRSPTSHDAGHYRQSLNNQSLVEESCNKNSTLSRTSQDLLDN
ncbi:hypothetical protein MN608_09337 [Microdochium nivale]|nr:hypothetical protein MN608_09337 [Microdochium nivale]